MKIRDLQRGSGLVLAVVTVLLLADSAFLVTSATPDGLVAPMHRAHVWLGLALSLALAVFVATHFALHRRHRNTRARRVGIVVASVSALGCVAGLALWLAGSSRAALLLHELAFVVAIGAYLLHRLRALVTPVLALERGGAIAAVLGAAAIWVAQLVVPAKPDAIDRPALARGLSQANTIDGHVLGVDDLDNPQYCAQCHPAIAERWAASAHRFSSLNDPFYAATLASSQQRRTPDELKFCGGCHDPLLLFTGRMDAHPRPEDPGADAGITCLACHAITEAPSRLGNGSYVLATPDHYPDFDADDPDAREASNRLIRSKPAKHIASFGPDHLRTPELCAPCHKAHIPGELNRHRWLRGQNEYDAWHDSGAGTFSARTFFPPKQQKRCQDCHMPRIEADDPAAKDGTVADHAFLGANTALPRQLGIDEWVARNEAFLRDVLTVDVGALDIDAGRVLAPPPAVQLPAGASIVADIVVRNVGSGHFYPAGIADLREAWLEVVLVNDDDGEVALASGWLDARGNLDPDAHHWQAVLLDEHGKPLTVHDVERAQVVLTSRRILLGASDIVRVAFTAPDRASRLAVRVLDRKLPRDYVEFAVGPDAAAMPVSVVATTSIAIAPGNTGATEPHGDPLRLRNLGIGHLLRGDTALAREASEAAAARMPDDPGPRLDLARAALDDGDLDAAEAHVAAADAIAPGHATAAWLLGRIRAAQGDHPAAIAALDVALTKFPRDREVLASKADSLFRLERDAEAAAVLESVLEIDPEHLAAHALLTRIRRDQGDEVAATHHQAIWDRVRPHSDDEVVSEAARRAFPALDRRANPQYILPLSPPQPGWGPAR